MPGRERAFVCTGAPGPLVEIDLETGETTTRHDEVGWSVGFLDADHYAVLAARELRVHRYEDPITQVATAPIAGYNIAVGDGRVYTLDGDELEAYGLDLTRQLRAPLPKRAFAISFAATRDGRRLACAVDTEGEATWFDTGPAD